MLFGEKRLNSIVSSKNMITIDDVIHTRDEIIFVGRFLGSQWKDHNRFPAFVLVDDVDMKSTRGLLC